MLKEGRGPRREKLRGQTLQLYLPVSLTDPEPHVCETGLRQLS